MALQKILIVDDSEAIHVLLRAYLEDEHLELHSVRDGESALHMAVRLQPDLILLDLDLPRLDGFEVCRRLREDAFTLNVPVIFLTAAGGLDEKVFGLGLGACDYITKPFEPSELIARMRVALRAKSRFDFLSTTRVTEFMGDSLRARGTAAAKF